MGQRAQLDLATPTAALFDAPRDRLGGRLHGEVFGALSSATARALDVPEVAAAVRPLLARGWRPAQLGARVGALPAQDDPAAGVVAFLQSLLDREPPARAWERERAARAEVLSRPDKHAVASDDARAHWAAQARRSLAGRQSRVATGPERRVTPAPSQPPSCATCTRSAGVFVTRAVRLCDGCVALLSTGRARLAVDG